MINLNKKLLIALAAPVFLISCTGTQNAKPDSLINSKDFGIL